MTDGVDKHWCMALYQDEGPGALSAAPKPHDRVNLDLNTVEDEAEDPKAHQPPTATLKGLEAGGGILQWERCRSLIVGQTD